MQFIRAIILVEIVAVVLLSRHAEHKPQRNSTLLQIFTPQYALVGMR